MVKIKLDDAIFLINNTIWRTYPDGKNSLEQLETIRNWIKKGFISDIEFKQGDNK